MDEDFLEDVDPSKEIEEPTTDAEKAMKPRQSVVKVVLPYLAICVGAIILTVAVIIICDLRKENRPSVAPAHTETEEPFIVVSSTEVPGESNEPMDPTGPGETPETFHSDLNVVGLEQNAYPEINTLIEKYFCLLIEKNVDELNKIVESEHRMTEEDLPKSLEYTEEIYDISCYTMKGLVDNTYIVYVYYKVKLLNIETAAPSLVRMFVYRNEDGDVYIYNGAVSDEMQTYSSQMDNKEDVRILISEVNKKFRDACANDEGLNAFYNKLLNDSTGTTSGTTAAPSSSKDDKDKESETSEKESEQDLESEEEETSGTEESGNTDSTESEQGSETEEDRQTDGNN